MRSHSMTRFVFYLFGEKYDFYKRLGIVTYFYFIFKGKQNKKKNLNVTPYLIARVAWEQHK